MFALRAATLARARLSSLTNASSVQRLGRALFATPSPVVTKPKKTPNADEKESVKVKEMSAMLGKYLWLKGETGLKMRVVSAMGLLVGAKLTNIYVPILFKETVDALASPNVGLAIAIPFSLLVGYGAARGAASLFNEMRNVVFAKVAQNAIRQVSLKIFRHLHELDLNFHLSRQTGALSRIIDRGTRGINFVLTAMLFNIAPTILEIGLVSALLAYSCGIEFVAVTLGTLAAYSFFTIWVTQWRTQFRKQQNVIENDMSSKVLESLINYETVKYFGNEQMEAKRYDQSLAKYENVSVKNQTSLGLLNFGQSAIFTVGMTGLMYLAAKGVVSGEMTVGDLVMVNGLLFQLSIPLNFLGTMYREMRQSFIDMEAMFGLLSVPAKITNKENAPPMVVTGGSIKFDNVSFAYAPEREILRDVTFDVPAGKTVAIVGPSGCGKSTIMRLLFRFYDVTNGSIKIDDQDIRDVQVDSLRKNLGVVPQDMVLFNESVFYNIAYGRPEATEEEVHQAARSASIHEVITRFPDGYQTKVGERGLKISGGEKQRVAIARTMLKKPSILLCDEATSALDSGTESEILSSLKQLAKDRTTIFIAHRLSTVMDVDEILVMDHGRIVERGTHRELITNPQSRYAAMWRQQMSHGASMADEPETNAKPAKVVVVEKAGPPSVVLPSGTVA